MSPKHHVISIQHALAGLWYAVRSQPNFIVHLGLSFLVILAGIIFSLNSTEWLIVIFTISLGLVIELINTAIESVVDLVTQEWRLMAKHAKDTAAAAMLVYAFGAVTIAAIIFIPKIWQFI